MANARPTMADAGSLKGCASIGGCPQEAHSRTNLRRLRNTLKDRLSKALSIALAAPLLFARPLRSQAEAATAGHAVPGAPFDASGDEGNAFGGLDQLLTRVGEILRSLPDLGGNLAAAAARLDGEAPGTGLGWFLVKLLLGAALAVAAERLVRGAIAQWYGEGKAEAVEGRRLAWRALLDLVAILPLWLILYGLSSHALRFNPIQQRVIHIVFTNVLIWRVAILVPRIWFRPGMPSLRIGRIDDRDASTLYYAFSMVALGYALVRSVISTLVAADAPADAIVVQGFLNDLVIGAVALAAIWITRHAAARWLAALVDNDGSALAKFKLQLAEHWWAIAVLALFVMSGAFAYGMLSGNHNAGLAIVSSFGLALALVFLETLFDDLGRPRAVAEDADETERSSPKVSALVIRCLRFVSWLLIIVAITEIWLFDVVPSQFSSARHASLSQAIRDISITIAVSYLIWQVACFLVARQLASAGPSSGDAGAEHDQPDGAASRLHTLLPLARGTLGVTIAVLAGLTILTRLGVNTTHLIAGASVLGLAISFGSQTLVRDIVSGVFYLADDAFRIGEYVDAGRVKGNVEGFTLRSVKLRHQNGQVHIVPFGQLGSITNFSRDWITMKFNLRVARDADLELVRKTTKKIGQEMMDDPELAPLIIDPLKLQGVAGILDNALLLRFKVTTKPGNPSLVQRQAVKRIISRFPEAGIHFPGAATTV
jgi:small-conductance mechanosensitive channel